MQGKIGNRGLIHLKTAEIACLLLPCALTPFSGVCTPSQVWEPAIPRWWLHAYYIATCTAGTPTEKTLSPPAVATKDSLHHMPSHVTLNQSPAREEEHATWPDLSHKERASEGGFKVFY